MANGWFGEPWWSYVCYDEAGRLLEDLRVPFPDGKACMWCEETFAEGDSGQEMPAYRASGPTIEHVHKECLVRMTLGCVAHLEGRCMCHGGDDYEEPGFTKREDAIAAWDWIKAHGVGA